MQAADRFKIINIRRYLDADDSGQRERELSFILNGFSCPKNHDVEHFLKENAIEFSKKSQSITYIVASLETHRLLGYFTIALKPLTIRGDALSNTMKKKVSRISELDEQSDTYTMAAYLIAQLGKNYTAGLNENITGAELLELAWDIIKDTQTVVGGVVAFLEAENEEKLLKFYNENGFRQFDTRLSSSKIAEAHELVQLLRLL